MKSMSSNSPLNKIEMLSHQFLITGIGFALTSGILVLREPMISSAMGATSGAFILFSTLLYRNRDAG